MLNNDLYQFPSNRPRHRSVFPVNLSYMKKPAKSRKKQPVKDQQTPKPETIEEKEEKPFDFGGIPARDLKKNLGCG